MNLDLNTTMEHRRENCGDVNLHDHGCEYPGNSQTNNNVEDDSEQCDADEEPNFDSESLCLAIEKKLEIDSIVESLDQGYLLYCEYARCRGFSVRKGDQSYYWGTKEIRTKEFKCSCEGFHDDKRSKSRLAVYKKQNIRTDCKARIRIVRDKQNGCDGIWKVQKFDKEHNHELVPYHQSYMLRSARQLTHAKKSLMEALKSAGIGVSRAYKFLEKESGGPHNIGFTRRDAYNHLEKQRMKTAVDNVDANALVQFFVRRSIEEPFFYWNVQLDDDGRLMNFFFRDSRCLIDYEYFGDVLSVDTTYKTNKYDLICAPFVGINHHMRNVMFGLAFLSNETSMSFEWLFNTFLESMHGKEPQVIFSDQSAALMSGIDSVFRTSRHRLCQWHISRNAPSHFGALNCNSEFKKRCNFCMNGVETEPEFEARWASMVHTYDLGDNRWFTSMYKLRQRWASVFTQTCFSAGLLATSRSELTNKVLKDLCTASSSLIEFVEGYQKIVADWRTIENADDFLNIGTPGIIVSNSLLLTQASKILTRSVYKAFESQFALSTAVAIIEHPINRLDIDLQYKVASQPSMTRIRCVQYNRHDKKATCSCHMWEIEGVVCRHIFRVYMDLNVTHIPECYFLHRWSKIAKHRHPEEHGGFCQWNGGDFVDEIAFVNYVMRMSLEVSELAKFDRSQRKKVVDCITSLKNDINANVSSGEPKEKNRCSNDKLSQGGFPKIVRDPPPKRRATSRQSSPLSHWSGKKKKIH